MHNPSGLELSSRRLSKRLFLKVSSLSTPAVGQLFGQPIPTEDWPLRLGLISDIHYADLPAAGSRHYRDSIQKVREAIARFNDAQVDAVLCLGDLIDSGSTVEKELGHLQTIREELKQLQAPIAFVLGNHCVWGLTKQEFLTGVGQASAYQCIRLKGIRLILLDACYRHDGAPYGRQNYDWKEADIPISQQLWLEKTLQDSEEPALVFVHHRLDVDNHYGIRSAAKVRRILEESGQVAAVFQGHNHLNAHQIFGEIHYLTMQAMIEGKWPEKNAYSLIHFNPAKGDLIIEGVHDQASYQIKNLA